MSTTGKEYKLAIRIAGVIDKSFGVSLATANSTLKKNVAAINSDFTKLDKGFNSIMKTGQKCFSAIATAAGVAAAAIAAASVASVAVGSEFESAFAGVKKTVDATEQEYAKLREEIIAMSGEIPSSAAEIAAVMEIAGQLGIATDSLSDFTKTMINLGVSTNLEATEAADALARFANVTNMANYDENGISNYERLGSVVVDLGNNFATTEEEIVAMATNLAATGDMVGLSQAQIMSLATAMSATGIRAEKGGSAMSKLLKKMQIATEEGGDSLEDYARVANMTGEQFKETFQKDAVVALAAFLEGINDTDRLGQSAILTLKDMKLSEVRLSDVILRLANAEGDLSDAAVEAAIADELFSSEAVDASYSASLLGDAIELANRAWDENTALAIEAGKRNETAESQLKKMGNAFTNLGIAAYDGLLREPYVDTISNITEAVKEFTKNDLPKWIGKINTSIPTMQRKVKSAWKVVSPFFNGLMNVGKWLLKNPDVIVGTIVGIGTALAAYKIASTITHIVNSIISFVSAANPVTLGIMAIVAALGLVAGAIAKYKEKERELINENLASHFGNIALSMEEIQKIAEYIVSSDSLGGVKEALEAFEDLDAISSTMEESIKEINKLNWKVSIGMELTEDENEAYKQAIDEYVKSAQEYALQSQYAVSLNLAIGFTEEDAESQNVVTKVNQFYQDKYDELAALGTQLNEAVTDAFNDGLLDIKETQVIADIQAKMAAIQESLATGEFDAQLSILGMDYGGSLSADSFQNLQEELARQVEEASRAYRESYAKNYASVQAAYEAGEYLSESEYQDAIDALQKRYLQNVGELQARSINFQLETIMKQYADELDPAMEDYVNGLREVIEWSREFDFEGDFENSWSKWYSVLYDQMQKVELDKTTRGALQKLLDAMAPSMEDMKELQKQYEDAGIQMSEAMAEGLQTFNLLAVLADNAGKLSSDGISDGIDGAYIAGQQMAEAGLWDSYLEGVIKYAKSHGYVVQYDFMKNGALDTSAAVAATEIEEAGNLIVRPVVEGMYAWSQETIDEYYSNGFDVNADLRINLNPIYNGLPVAGLSREMNKWALPNLPGIDRNADGGIIQNKELSWIAENGPESIIPLDGSENAISLWEKTGKLLGMESVLDRYKIDGGDNNYSIEYSPTFQFYGEAPSKEDMVDAARISQEEFDQRMDQYFKTHRRVSFG